ncbi:MAG: hypothetical protein JSS43_17910 [Proteobacteria bacterium]|nr:hypothetical protein [Pseudomonadota bacterium]
MEAQTNPPVIGDDQNLPIPSGAMTAQGAKQALQGTPTARSSHTMTTIDVFYQGEGISEIAHLEVDADHSFAAVRIAIMAKHGLAPDTLIYLEDADEPIDEACLVHHHVGRAGIKAHVHRCRHVAVSVTFNGETVRHRFGPGTTVARVETWAAERKFGMTPQEAGEHVLQIAGTKERPDPGTHLGTLATCPDCHVAFDLVPNERVNGHPVGMDLA